MKTFSRITLLSISIILMAVTGLMAQREISGTIYMNGKPAAGVTVEANRARGTALTDFDGKYKIEADSKTKWIKFTAPDGTERRLDIDENSGDVVNCALTGEIPSGNEEEGGTEVSTKSQEELLKDANREYMNEVSLYGTDLTTGDTVSAFSHWKTVYTKYPASSINVYIHGAKIYEYLIEHAKTDEEKDKELGEMMKMYDKRIKYFGEKGNVLARKANSWLKYNITSRNNPVEGDKLTEVFKKAYEWLNASVSELGSKSEPSTLLLFMRSSVALFKGGELPKETVVKNYDLSTGILNQIIKENKDAEAVRNAKIVQPYIEDVFGESGAADCEALVNIYTPQFEENKDDAEFIKTMLQKLRKANCDNNELLEKASIRLYELEPSAEAAFNMAHSYLSKNDIADAKKFYKQAIDQETDPKLLATYYYEYGLVLYSNDKNFPEAREMARKAIANDPTLCKAYILIGDIYVAASSTFSSDPFEKSSVFWVAVDYYNKAKTYEDCSMDAAKKAADYKKYFPKSEDAFMNGVHEGDTYKVEGWINETTKARF